MWGSRTLAGTSPMPTERLQRRHLGHARMSGPVLVSTAPRAIDDSGSTCRSGGLLAAAALVALIRAGLSPPSAAQSSASYQMPRQSIDGGAARSTSASYALNGSIGQPDAGATSSSASYSLSGGFHRNAAAPPPDALFANGFESP